jgi:hypothetical protein
MIPSIFFILLTLTTVLALPLHDTPSSIVKRDASDLRTRLRNANTAVERTLILGESGNASFTFDFNNPPNGSASVFPAGKLIKANIATFPALTGVSSSLVVATVGPCGLVAPHMHPRGDEFIVITEGRLFTQFLSETGSILVTNELQTYMATLLPKGSVHLEYNPDCTEAKFVAAFNDNDAGTTLVAPTFFSLEDEMVLTALGGKVIIPSTELDSVRQSIPKTAIYGVQSCMARCGID